MNAALVLENGTIIYGNSIGTEGTAMGEVCFNTSMSGYQEILTDPSYCGQIVTMTYPMIGNVGVNMEDVESIKPQVSGFVMKEYSTRRSNYRAVSDLDAYLKQNNIVAIEGIDTRMLTRMIRTNGAMRGMITTEVSSENMLLDKVRDVPDISARDLAEVVTTPKTYAWNDAGMWNYANGTFEGPRFSVAVLDYGVKQNILRRLARFGCDLTVYPSSTPAEEILNSEIDGIFLSNGPGDPTMVRHAVENLKQLIGRKPIFGICLGHQLLSRAFGAKTYKLKFGHRGANHPVMNLLTSEIEITSQNHGFAVDADTMPEELELTHVNLNDNTVEGFRHRELPVFCVQYHPEASPGPHDSDYLFREFREMMEKKS